MTWTKFQDTFVDADRKRRRATKSAGGPRKAAQQHSVNNMTTQEDLGAMFAAAMANFADAAEESIHAAIKSKFKESNSRGRDDKDRVDKDENDVESMKKQIRALQKQLEVKKKGENPQRGDKSSGKKCEYCKNTHRREQGNKCWRKPENRVTAPKWWLDHNPIK